MIMENQSTIKNNVSKKHNNKLYSPNLARFPESELFKKNCLVSFLMTNFLGNTVLNKYVNKMQMSK
jgi:hypothetical protein